ncbi:hypothetical protein ACJQWK_10561 [Exserohilum turcicum]|uniref:Zn(2)-C6 fungal-type domain-containing protein n=1 Tax=Exserohilum turcicum (strain 28A) TaxID=671987 RepID=R0JYF8_EXST2|nr:uncharacterized protein SETTUDRAFT_157217 [Exserohilum turcica Et28A]EOA81267.1 hypothetical protein SETTUDRAFT_157217 [Exserohilum turcica Et28A]
MLGYISSTRKKSCTACVKAKRRCDLGYPFCKRCFVKGLDCSYPNPSKTPVSVRDAEVVIRRTTPDISLPATTAHHHVGAHEPGNIALDPLALAASDESTLEAWLQDGDGCSTTPELCRTLMPSVALPVILNNQQTIIVVEGLCALVNHMAYSGTTHFLHRNLYPHDAQPAAYQDCVAIAALYMAQNVRNTSILVNSINAKISIMIREARNWTLMNHLAAVQALIIYQIIRLFDPSLGAQADAVKHNALLETWATDLLKRSFYDTLSFPDAHARWVFNESLRRTVFMSVFTRCAWSVFTKGGLADQVHILAAMPLTKDLGRWTRQDTLCGIESIPSKDEDLVSYLDLSRDWSYDKSVKELGPFGKFLLAPCRGDDQRLLV